MKAFILALALLVAPMGASAEPNGEQCQLEAQVVWMVVMGRDNGVTVDDMVEYLRSLGAPDEVIASILTRVLVDSKGKSASDIGTEYFYYCMGYEA